MSHPYTGRRSNRYVLRRVKANGRPVAIGMPGVLRGHYVSDANAIRFMRDRLRATNDVMFPPGAYQLSHYPRPYDRAEERVVETLRKQGKGK